MKMTVRTSLLLLPLLPLAACSPRPELAEPSGAANPPARSEAPAGPTVEAARATLVPIGDSGVTGSVVFERVADGVRVTGRIEGLTPGEHGFHVHTFGDLSDREKGASAGGHYAPEGHHHGRPTDEDRHAGDFGNVVADADGTVTLHFVDHVVALSGAHSVVGRAVVVHADADHFTQPSGDAGARVAFGVIGIAEPPTE